MRANSAKWYLLIILLIGIFIRFAHLNDTFFFGYDQARDLHEIYKIATQHDIKINGPGTDIPGVYHGVLNYYLLLPGYFLSSYNPNSAAILLSFINLLGIPLIFYFGKKLLNETVGLIAAFLWAISFELANYSRFISNVSLIPVASAIFFLGLYEFCINKKQRGIIISALGYGLAIHANFYLVYLGIFYAVFYFIYKPEIKLKPLIISGIAFIILVSSFILSEIKFNFMGVTSLLNFVGDTNTPVNLQRSIALYFLSIAKTISRSFFPIHLYAMLPVFVIMLFVLFRKKELSRKLLFLFIWSLSTLPLFLFSRTNAVSGEFIQSSIIASNILIMSLGIYYLFQHNKITAYSLVLAILLGTINIFISTKLENTTFLAYQPMLYKDQKAVADYTYQSSGKKKFSICTVSNPLFVNTLWSTVYKVHGEKTYGYMPSWSGPGQQN
jgi:hypothetical protein